MSKQADTPVESDKGKQFEAELAELEALVAKMESGDLPLEESLALFERGVALTRSCEATLKQAELRVESLVKQRDEQ